MGRRVVVTGLFALAACGASAKPPAPVPIPAPQPEAEPITVANPPSPRLLNGRDPMGRVILRHPDGTCFVNLPPPPAPEGERISFRPPPTEPVPCPPAMTQPAWAECAFGQIHQQPGADGSPGDCVCHVFGNPPPPPRPLASCPSPTPE